MKSRHTHPTSFHRRIPLLPSFCWLVTFFLFLTWFLSMSFYLPETILLYLSLCWNPLLLSVSVSTPFILPLTLSPSLSLSLYLSDFTSWAVAPSFIPHLYPSFSAHVHLFIKLSHSNHPLFFSHSLSHSSLIFRMGQDCSHGIVNICYEIHAAVTVGWLLFIFPFFGVCCSFVTQAIPSNKLTDSVCRPWNKSNGSCLHSATFIQ